VIETEQSFFSAFRSGTMTSRISILSVALFVLVAPVASTGPRAAVNEGAVETVIEKLSDAHGASHEARITRGVSQVAERWWPEDGSDAQFVGFCREYFISDEARLEAVFLRMQDALEQIDGHLHEVRRELTTPLDLDTGEVGPADRLLGEMDLAAHVNDDLFRSKVAFLALLNFPVHTLAERLEASPQWSRRDWAQSRMMDRFATRVPAAVAQEITAAFTRADQYIADYNIRMDRVLSADGERLFPEGLRLITHWGLRDELKSQYAEGEDGLARQRAIQRVMERIVRQEIPGDVIDNPDLFWTPETNEVRSGGGSSRPGEVVSARREGDMRYARLLEVFRAVRAADEYSPTDRTYIDRRFNRDREIPERDVEALLVSVLTSDEFRDTAALIRRRLGRPLRAFDIWYDGFQGREEHAEADLDRIVASRYPEVDAFQTDLSRILRDLGFGPNRATWLAEKIVVDPSRGAGHAMGAVRREDEAHLRTRFGEAGMDYKGYNIAIHELGHNVEQVFSLNGIDYWWLNGVPNTAFTEALAFVFQNRDLELLGLDSPGADARHLEALDTLWATAEIGGVALVDMAVWRWMYRNPQAGAAQLRQATLRIARDVWNRYYAPVFGVRDQEILAIYSHMIVYGLYLPDYPLGHIIAFQIADRLRGGDFGEEFERLALQGRLTPDAWMRGAVGHPISTEPLLAEARAALDALP
jgi:hypothetical protein